ncbi:MAG: FkbM family methyltransferase [Actinomadura sp.]
MTKLIWDHPANRGRRGRALVDMALWQTWKRTVGRPFGLTVYGDMKFRAYSDSSQPGRFIYFGGIPDYAEMMFMRRYLRAGDGFIDGGANEGMFTLLAGKLVGATGAVCAFEAVPAYANRLRENVRANGLSWVTVHPDALGAEPGTTPFVVRGAGSRIQTADDHGPSARLVDVRVVRLDDALPERSWAMGKLDVEGAEHRVLAGAEALLARAEPAVWMLELVEHFLVRFGSSVTTVREWLGDHRYDLAYYDPGAGRLKPAPDPLSMPPNVFAVARERWAEVAARLRPSS